MARTQTPPAQVESIGKISKDSVYAVRLDQAAKDGRTLSTALFGDFLQKA